MGDVEFGGPGIGQLEALGHRLKGAANGGLRRELLAAIRKAAKPIPDAAKASALEKLPHRGGLAELVARSRISTRTRLTGQNVGVRVEAKGIYNLRRMDGGAVRHPVFGNRGKWAEQSIPSGWFSEPAEAAAEGVRGDIEEAMKKTANQISGGAL